MTRALILDLTSQTMLLVLILSLPPIITATFTGLLVSLLQALTQIQEQTLSFAVKLIVVVITILLTAYWIGGELMNFTLRIFNTFPYLNLD
jgi:type III secretion protein S